MAMVMIPVAIIMLIFDNDQNSKANMEDKVYKILTKITYEFYLFNIYFLDCHISQKIKEEQNLQ